MPIPNSDCPVPFDQQPLNEYLILKKSWLFSWSTYKVTQYIKIITFVSSMLFIFNGLWIIYLFIHSSNLLKLLVLDLLICDLILCFLFIRIYLGWSYVIKRLLSATIFYEESGWYDGQIWVKTSKHLIQDRLIGLYEIMPFMNRVKCTCLMTIFIFIISCLLYNHF
uniref:Ycf36 n=1 Tax=Dasyclonium flaccidum TaxID=2007274 RepID=A0A1Z1MKN3_9FLOR|nr:hypothetical protein [Dasyclonium flaccidum]ARW66647.1 hypothetical protein [Dasyclonium flaccidum]